MSEPAFTPGPWRRRARANLANGIEGPTNRRHYEGDDGYRTVATYQDACDSDLYDEQEANREANGNLITAAPELYEALVQARKWLAATGIPHSNSTMLAVLDEALAKARGER